jgi:hypothetical protein
MEIAFIGEKDKFLVIYLDDITIFSRSDKEHCYHLRKVFLKCKKFGLSLNPKKPLFSMKEGKLLGHIVSAEGVRIDPSKVATIQTLSPPISKKEVQSFLGKINFLRRFVSNFVELYKILRVVYFWPSLFIDVYGKIRACLKCKKFSRKQQLKSLPLNPVVTSGPFQQWGLDFIGEIHPTSSGHHRWILTATDYFTKWIEAIPTR